MLHSQESRYQENKGSLELQQARNCFTASTTNRRKRLQQLNETEMFLSSQKAMTEWQIGSNCIHPRWAKRTFPVKLLKYCFKQPTWTDAKVLIILCHQIVLWNGRRVFLLRYGSLTSPFLLWQLRNWSFHCVNVDLSPCF